MSPPAADDDDANTREVIAGLRVQLAEAERERDHAHAQLEKARAELDSLKGSVQQLSSAWRHLSKQLG